MTQIKVFHKSNSAQAGVVNIDNGSSTVGYSGLFQSQRDAMSRIEREKITDIQEITNILDSVGLRTEIAE